MTSDPLALEIEQFEQQVGRDPDGRAFARLADAYRKDGQLERALDVLEQGLPKHDDYLSAHLVHARTLRSLGRPVEAIEAFERVVELDSASVIALRALAELAEEAGDTNLALGHIESLLQVLPQDEALEREADRLRRETGDVPVGAVEADGTQPEPDSPWLVPDADPEQDGSGATTEPLEAASWDVEGPAEGHLSDFVLELPDEGVTPEDFVLELPDEELDDGAQDFLLSLDTPMSEPIASGEDSVEAFAGDDQEDWRSSLSLMEDELDGIVIPELEDLAETQADSSVNPLEGWLVDDPAAAEPGEAEDVPGDGDLLTRTMADLYAAQGQPERAAEIYAELLNDLPEDEELRAALAEAQSKMRHVADVPSEPEVSDSPEPEPAIETPELVVPPTSVAFPKGSSSGTSEFFQEWLRSLED